MSDTPQIPTITGGAPISITRREVFSLDCPKCKNALDVTDLSFGTNIECPACKNITWRPEYKPKWWFRFRNFAIATLISFILGFSSSYLANIAFQQNQTATSKDLTEIRK